jgi:hypothetical protein
MEWALRNKAEQDQTYLGAIQGRQVEAGSAVP